MSNYENIKPYAEFAHEAAQHGGVMEFLDELADSNYKLGIEAERETELGKAALLLGVGIAAWEGGKFAIKKIKEHKHNKVIEASERAEKAKQKCMDAFETIDASETDD